MTPQRDLAYCLTCRASTLNAFDRIREAHATMHVAYHLWPCIRHAIWLTHFATKDHYPDKRYPAYPSVETAGKAARDRLIKSGKLVILPDPRVYQ